MTERQIRGVAWGSCLLFVGVSIAAWAGSFKGDFSTLTVYNFFPVLGLVAFSVMLSHYVASLTRRLAGGPPQVLRSYFLSTSYLVLACILLHPGLLSWQLWRDGLGLPPGSVKDYVGSGMYFFVILGVLALCGFLAFEFHRKFAGRSWWWMVERTSDIAMILIFFHALKLGSNIQTGWFRPVWFGYGVILAICLTYSWFTRPRHVS